MKRISLLLGLGLLICSAFPGSAIAQRNCGIGIRLQKLAVEQPGHFEQLLEARKQRMMAEAILDGTAAKSTGPQSPIPVVFHFILTPTQYNQIGRDTGIMRRVFSQLSSLNSDFNRGNGDSVQIPAAFKGLYANVGIRFGLASATNGQTILPGVEVKVLPAGVTPDYDVNTDCHKAKEATAIGLPAWDVNKYLNIWVVNITSGGVGQVVGITTPRSSIGWTGGGHTIGVNEIGVALNYGAIGVREFPTQHFIANIDRGRTLTHELGHFFELYHIWGDDFGACTRPTATQDDDLIGDTPPQADATYCNSGGCPTSTKTDACSPGAPGIMYMNYMDYVDDRAMVMFTHEQVTVMRRQIAEGTGALHSLTQHPELLSNLSVSRAVSEHAFRVFPNPATDILQVELSGSNKLLSIDVLNLVGQSVARIPAGHQTSYTLRLGDAPRGVYFVQCRFAEGTLTKKIVLQ